jgi:hypothetical protein
MPRYNTAVDIRSYVAEGIHVVGMKKYDDRVGSVLLTKLSSL